MTILETFIKLRDDLKTWVTNNLNQKANISYVDEKFDSIPEFDPTEIDNVVKHTYQTLTEEQKLQARENINAVSLEEVEELLGIEEEFSVSGELVTLDVDLEPDTELNVVSKIHRDSTWGESNKLVLHQVNGDNFVDLSGYLGGAGTVFEKNGLTATINTNGTLTLTGTNTSTGWTQVVSITDWNSDYSKRVYPAGTYIIPSGLTIQIRAAQYPGNVTISGLTGNLQNEFVATQPFRVIVIYYAVAGGASIDKTIPLGLFHSESIPESGYEYVGNVYSTTFDNNVYEGEYNWTTGELKDIDGNTVAYYEPQSIKKLSGINYFWTGFGENIISNKSSANLEKVVIGLNKPAPEETVPSICDFTLTPTTKNYSINIAGDSKNFFKPEGNLFYGMEVPLVTTRGKFIITNSDGLDEYELPIPELINYKNITDIMTSDNIVKRWSKRFYITRDPDFIDTIDDGSGTTTTNPNTIATWIFSKKEFEKYGLPVETLDIPIVSPIFTNATNDKLTSSALNYSAPYLGSFSYDVENNNYVFKCRARQFYAQGIYKWTNGYFCYPLKEEVNLKDNMLSLYISSGCSVRFEQDNAFDVFFDYALTQGWCPFYNDSYTALWNPNTQPADESAATSLIDVTPNVGIFVPRSIEDVLYEAKHIAKRLNYKDEHSEDYEINSYGWIGVGDGVTDYTEKIQSKLTEIHNTTDGGTVYLGTGTYPISGSLIVYSNTTIVGCGTKTMIKQTADNTNAIVINGSNITLKDFNIHLEGACSEITACVYINSENSGIIYGYPENNYAQSLTMDNIQMSGKYHFEYENDKPILGDVYYNYKGVGIRSSELYYNYAHIDNVHGIYLMAVVYNSGGNNYYNITAEFCKYGVYDVIACGMNTFFINGHPFYRGNQTDGYVSMSEEVVHIEGGYRHFININVYDTQHYRHIIYLGGRTYQNRYNIADNYTCAIFSPFSEVSADIKGAALRAIAVDLGRGNIHIASHKNTPFAIGNQMKAISGLTSTSISETTIRNALSGAGVWGNISSNVTFTGDGLELSEVCRYPSEQNKLLGGLPCIISSVAPSEDAPIEIMIDISNRPIRSTIGYFIQFDHRYVASDFTVSYDTTNDGSYNLSYKIKDNTDVTTYMLRHQNGAYNIYRIKFTFTKPLQIENFEYDSAGHTTYTINYNPDGLIGICNIGMTVNDYAGRSFLGECGGSLYGNVDMHRNTFKNLADPVDDGDAVSKLYLDNTINNISSQSPQIQIITWGADD